MLKSVVRKRPFWFLWGGQVAFSKKKKKDSGRSIFFFREEYHGQVKCYCTLCIIFGQYE